MKQKQLPSWRLDNIVPLIASAVMLAVTLGGVFYRQGVTDTKIDNIIQLLKDYQIYGKTSFTFYVF